MTLFKTGLLSFLISIAIVFVTSSCSNPVELEEQSEKDQYEEIVIRGETQGTTYTIKYFGEQVVTKYDIDSILEVIDLSMSTWDQNSYISIFNLADSGAPIDHHFLRNLMMSYIIYNESDGAFNPLVKPIINYWGFGENAKKPQNVDTGYIDNLLHLLQMNALKFQIGNKSLSLESFMLVPIELPENIILKKEHSDMKLDFNAIAQGYSVEELGRFISAKGISSMLIEIGGEMLARGKKPDGSKWKVGIDKPISEGNRELQATIELENKAIATSGNYRKYFELDGIKYHHTLDPKTGFPAKHKLLSATVIANECAMADAYATTLMVMGLEKSIKFLEKKKGAIDAFLIYSNEEGAYSYYMTPKIEKELKLN